MPVRWFIVFILSLIIGMRPVAAEDFPVSGTANPGPIAAKIDALIRRLMDDNGATAAEFTCIQDGRTIYRKAFGFINRAAKKPLSVQSSMRIGSNSKPLAAAMVHDLVRRGKLRMDAKPFAQWRTQQGLAYTDARVNDITIEMLLHHQGGWDRDATFDPAFGLPDQLACGHSFMDLTPITLIKLMSPQPLQFIPGKRECYSNFGYIVLGRVIEQTTGQSYRDYLRTFMNREIRSGEFDVSQKTPNSALGEPEYQTEPYNVAVMDAAGGTMASATGLCQFMRTFLISGERIPGGNWGFTFFGSIPGASSFVRQEIGSTNRVFAGILNARKNPLDHIPDEVDAILASH